MTTETIQTQFLSEMDNYNKHQAFYYLDRLHASYGITEDQKEALKKVFYELRSAGFDYGLDQI